MPPNPSAAAPPQRECGDSHAAQQRMRRQQLAEGANPQSNIHPNCPQPRTRRQQSALRIHRFQFGVLIWNPPPGCKPRCRGFAALGSLRHHCFCGFTPAANCFRRYRDWAHSGRHRLLRIHIRQLKSFLSRLRRFGLFATPPVPAGSHPQLIAFVAIATGPIAAATGSCGFTHADKCNPRCRGFAALGSLRRHRFLRVQNRFNGCLRRRERGTESATGMILASQ